MAKTNKKKKSKNILKDKFKSKEEKQQQLLIIYEKIANLGLNDEVSEIKEFLEICDKYLKDDTNIGGYTGKIKINGYKRIIEYILPIKKITNAFVNLRYDENV
jgi:triosephosphate isomerase